MSAEHLDPEAPAPRPPSREPAVYASALFLNLRNGRCMAQTDTTEDRHDCPWTARYFAVTTDAGVIAMCGTHVPDGWSADSFGPDVFDAEELTCQKHKETWDGVTPEYDDAAHRAEFHGLGGEGSPEDDAVCGDRAALLILHPDTEVRDPYAVCLRHARDSWLAAFEQDDRRDEDAQ